MSHSKPQVKKTSGLFFIPKADCPKVIIMITSFEDESETATVEIRKLEGHKKETVFGPAKLSIPARGGAQMSAGVDGNQAVEVNVTLSDDELKPSVTVLDLDTDPDTVLLHIPPGGFVPQKE